MLVATPDARATAAGQSDTDDYMRHIIAILLQNEAGALTRVAGLFSSRGYNIESLNVAPTEDPSVSRLTLVTKGSEGVIHQIASQLLKLVDVVSVEDMTRGEHVERELLILKLRVPGAQQAALRQLLAMGVRAEQQALAKWGLNFVIHEYLPRKLAAPETFLP